MWDLKLNTGLWYLGKGKHDIRNWDFNHHITIHSEREAMQIYIWTTFSMYKKTGQSDILDGDTRTGRIEMKKLGTVC